MEKYLILSDGINLDLKSFNLEEAKVKLEQMKTEEIGKKTVLKIVEDCFETDLDIALNVARENYSDSETVVEKIAEIGFLISTFILNLEEGIAKINVKRREENRIYFDIIGRCLDILLTNYSSEDLYSFLDSRKHWADAIEVEHPKNEIVSLLLEIMGNATRFNKTGMSVKPVLKLLGLKAYW